MKEVKQIKNTSVGFSDVDKALELDTGKEIEINAPKTIERLEQLSFEANERRKAEEAEDSEDEDGPLKIGDEVKLDLDDVDEIKNEIQIEMPPALEIETLI